MPFTKLRIVLIKPSKYDDDGYVIRFWKGVLPSNTRYLQFCHQAGQVSGEKLQDLLDAGRDRLGDHLEISYLIEETFGPVLS